MGETKTRVRWLTSEEVAERVRAEIGVPVPVTTIAGWRTRGVRGVRLRSRRVGGRVFVHPDELDRFLAATAEASGE